MAAPLSLSVVADIQETSWQGNQSLLSTLPLHPKHSSRVWIKKKHNSFSHRSPTLKAELYTESRADIHALYGVLKN
jgi:hypothetical protein